jgi:hypothetical protein
MLIDFYQQDLSPFHFPKIAYLAVFASLPSQISASGTIFGAISEKKCHPDVPLLS